MVSLLELLGVIVAALFSENFILVTCMGIGTRQEAFESPREARRTGIALTAVMVLATLVSWCAYRLVLRRYGLEYLDTLVFTLLVLGTVALLRRGLRAFLPELSRRLDPSLAALTTNCAALGVVLLTVQRGYGLGEALVFALFGGIGATLAMVSFAGVRGEVDMNSCPAPFRGTPILLLTAGLMAMALMGFYGLSVL